MGRSLLCTSYRIHFKGRALGYPNWSGPEEKHRLRNGHVICTEIECKSMPSRPEAGVSVM